MADEQNRSDAQPDAGQSHRRPGSGGGRDTQHPAGDIPTGKGKDDPSEAPESGDKKATG